MLVARSMDPGSLSNTYLVAHDRCGTAIFVDSTHTHGKALVGFDGGTDALVCGSRVERS